MTGNFTIYGDKNIINNKLPICVTIGNFDGVHLGHKYLLDFMSNVEKNTPIIVVTFSKHSSNFFTPGIEKLLLTNNENKINLLLKYGASAVIVEEFNEDFASFTADEFCENWLNKYFNIHSIILGYNFFYGKNKQGNFLHMKNYAQKTGWRVLQAPSFESSDLNKKISSSSIRNEIALGNVEIAEKLLGRPYSLSGVVIHGDQRGRVIGFPTANLSLDCNYVVPKYGVYACYVEINNIKFKAVMNCGVRPSVGQGLKLQIEAHILNFNEDIYGEEVKFHLKKYLREEKKFSCIEELKSQISEDIKQAQLVL